MGAYYQGNNSQQYNNNNRKQGNRNFGGKGFHNRPGGDNNRRQSEPKEPVTPYNFVPFAECAAKRYETLADIPAQDRTDPQLLSGEIEVAVTAETPIYISNGKRTVAVGADFFRGADGKYQIPGSTLRGLIRQNMQILGYGLVRPGQDVPDIRLYYRCFAAADGTVRGALKTRYKQVFQDEITNEPREIKAGWLHNENGRYSIYPAYNMYRVKKNAPQGEPRALGARWRDRTAENIAVAFRVQDDKVVRLEECPRKQPPAPGMTRGTLHCVGWMKKQNTLYLFTEEDPSQAPIPLDPKDILDFEIDFDRRQNQLGRNKDFWALPPKGKKAPVFYMIMPNGRVQFGMSRRFRLRYEHSVAEGIPEFHREHKDELFLDYPYAIMGFAGKDACLRSRVSVGCLPVSGEVKTKESYPVILAEPKPTYCAAYISGKNGAPCHYDSPGGFALRGYKYYWLKEWQAPQRSGNGGENVQTVLRPLPPQTRFTGVIRYRNLHEDELGLLLRSICPAENVRQSLGMGKPYGFGRVRIQITELREFRPETLYSAFAPQPVTAATAERLAELDSAYQTKLRELLKQEPGRSEGLPEVLARYTMGTCVFTADQLEKVGYCAVGEFAGVTKHLPQIDEFVERTKPRRL